MRWLCALYNWIIDPTNLTAISTLIIAVFTIVLAAVGYCQARLIRKSIDLARDEFISSQRPKVVIRQIVIWQPSTFQNVFDGEPVLFAADEELRGHVDLANIGGTTATVEFICNIFDWRRSPLPMVPPYDKLKIDRLEPLVILKAGERHTLGGLKGGPLSADVIDYINAGEIKLYVMGWVRYTDDRNVIRETRFCRIWNIPEHRFSAVDHPDYEYSE